MIRERKKEPTADEHIRLLVPPESFYGRVTAIKQRVTMDGWLVTIDLDNEVRALYYVNRFDELGSMELVKSLICLAMEANIVTDEELDREFVDGIPAAMDLFFNRLQELMGMRFAVDAREVMIAGAMLRVYDFVRA